MYMTIQQREIDIWTQKTETYESKSEKLRVQIITRLEEGLNELCEVHDDKKFVLKTDVLKNDAVPVVNA